jgi:hypothetical protein
MSVSPRNVRTRVCRPDRRSSLSRPRDLRVCRARSSVELVETSRLACVSRPIVGRACRDLATCVCVAPDRRSSLSRPRDVHVCRCRGIRASSRRVSTGSTHAMVAPCSYRADACVSRPIVGRACRDPVTRVCVAPDRRSSLSRPRDVRVCRCRGIRGSSRRVSTGSTHALVAPCSYRADACVSRSIVGRACRDLVTCVCVAAAAAARRLTGSRQARPTQWSHPVRTARMRVCRARSSVELVETSGRACVSRPIVGRACRDLGTCVCVAPDRRSSLSRPRDGSRQARPTQWSPTLASFGCVCVAPDRRSSLSRP